jgi:predicted site-specific integrase-resolvase
MKLREYCKNIGISYRTGWRWYKKNKIKGAYQTESGTIIIPENDNTQEKLDKILSEIQEIKQKLNQ